MNMKKTIYTAIATLLFLISSCTLEQEVYNKINPGMFPQNAEDVNALVNSSAYYVFSPWGIFEVAAGYGNRLCGKHLGMDYRIQFV
jgi:hypothetical protein